MNPIEIPERFNYIAAFLTLRCSLGCSYCINHNSKLRRNRNELSADEWIDSLNRLKTREDLPVTFEGGEPTQYPGFYDVINGLKPEIRIDVLTNLQFDIDEFVKMVDPRRLSKGRKSSYKSIRASFHVEKMNLEDTIKKAIRLQEAGFNVGLFSLNLPQHTEANMEMAETARRNGIYFFIKDFLGERNGRLFGNFMYPNALSKQKKNVMCRNKELLIAPDGQTYRCHRDLYHSEYPTGNLRDDNFVIEDIFRPCGNYGFCNPCDIKLKTNRFLQMGSCSVEIKELEDGK